MPKVSLNTPAPNFTLEDYRGKSISLSDYQDKKNVVVVFNRGFM